MATTFFFIPKQPFSDWNLFGNELDAQKWCRYFASLVCSDLCKSYIPEIIGRQSGKDIIVLFGTT
ncbi:MAG: hypothetical protein IJ719_05715 [Clostridia bacterium]|nr:hypothetical protein [Clostridia bacterium]